MTTSLNFETVEEFTEYTQTARAEICSCILSSLQDAYEEQEDEPVVLEVTLSSDKHIYEIILNRQEWATALGVCRDIFVDNEFIDEAIDVYEFLKKLEQN